MPGAAPRPVRLLAPLRGVLRGLALLRREGSAVATLDSGVDLLLRTGAAPDTADRVGSRHSPDARAMPDQLGARRVGAGNSVPAAPAGGGAVRRCTAAAARRLPAGQPRRRGGDLARCWRGCPRTGGARAGGGALCGLRHPELRPGGAGAGGRLRGGCRSGAASRRREWAGAGRSDLRGAARPRPAAGHGGRIHGAPRWCWTRPWRGTGTDGQSPGAAAALFMRTATRRRWRATRRCCAGRATGWRGRCRSISFCGRRGMESVVVFAAFVRKARALPWTRQGPRGPRNPLLLDSCYMRGVRQ